MARRPRRRGAVKDRPGTPRPSAGLLVVASGVFAASLLMSLLGLFTR